MDAAIRSTNAQYDDPEILNHLDVRLMNNFEGDTGWDIFTLQYTVRGPLSTMLEPSMAKYLQLFRHLWRIKHLEYVLSSKIWREQICNAKVRVYFVLEMKECVSPFIFTVVAKYEKRIESSYVSITFIYIRNDSFYPSNSVLYSFRSG